PGADIEELPDTHLAGQIPHRPDQERAVGPGELHGERIDLLDLIPDLPVDRVVVLAAQPVVPDPGGLGHRSVDLGAGCPVLTDRSGTLRHEARLPGVVGASYRST